MTWVKVCGVTGAEAAQAAEAAGADAIGLVFDENSPRRVTTDQAQSLARNVSILRIAVTVDAGWPEVSALVEAAGLDGVQPHGRHGEAVAAAAVDAGLFVLRPVVVEPGLDLARLPDREVPLLEGTPLGGTGRTFDWDQIGDQDRPFVLAGGLGPANVADAIESTGAWGVDASSGLESAPGIKDPDLIAAFVREAKA